MSAIEEMAKAYTKKFQELTEGGVSQAELTVAHNAAIRAVLDALISHLKAGAPEMVEAFWKGFMANKKDHDGGAVEAGLIAFIEAAKGEKR